MEFLVDLWSIGTNNVIRLLSRYTLKAFENKITKGFTKVLGHDTFVVLPMGYGKSVSFLFSLCCLM